VSLLPRHLCSHPRWPQLWRQCGVRSTSSKLRNQRNMAGTAVIPTEKYLARKWTTSQAYTVMYRFVEILHNVILSFLCLFPLCIERPLPLTIHPSVCPFFKQLADNGNTLRGEFAGRSSIKNAYMLFDMSSQVPSFSDFDRKETDVQSGYQTKTSSPKL
jgi:hypothetical protein